MITVHPDQTDPKYKHNHMACRAYFQPSLYVDGVYARIDTHMLKLQTPSQYGSPLSGFILWDKYRYCHNQDRGGGGHLLIVFHGELQGKNTMIYQWSNIWNGKNRLKGYVFGRNNSHSTVKWGLYIPEMYYDKETRVMVNQSVNEFYTLFLFKIDALPHDAVLTLGIAADFFNKLIPDIREFLIS